MNVTNLDWIVIVLDKEAIYNDVWMEATEAAENIMTATFENAANPDDVHRLILANGTRPGARAIQDVSRVLDEIENTIEDAAKSAVFHVAKATTKNAGVDEGFAAMCAHNLLKCWDLTRPTQEAEDQNKHPDTPF